MRRRHDDQDMPQPVSVFIGTMLIGPFIVGLALWGMVFAVNAGKSLYAAVRSSCLSTER